MRQKSWFIILVFPLLVHALTAELKQKYPHAVLTDDYGILDEIDLNSELDGVKLPPAFSTKAKGYIYWQCFPRTSVSVSLEDLGYSPEDDPGSNVKYNGQNDSRLTIIAEGKRGIMHKYVMWGNYPITTTEDRFNTYLKAMHGEKKICIAGSYLEKRTRKTIGEIETSRQQIYYWAFEKIKTMKGCEAYHRNGCHVVSAKT